MSKVHITGSDVDVSLGGLIVNLSDFSVSVEDGVKPTSTRGVPNGYVKGPVTASGEVKLDTENFNLVMGKAKEAGSFQDMEPIDIDGLGKTINQEFGVTVYGCKLKLSEVLSASGEGGEKLMHTIPYDVTSPRFLDINGVPYLSADRAAIFAG